MSKCIQPGCDKAAASSWGNCKFHWGTTPPEGEQTVPEIVPVASVIVPDQIVVGYTPGCLCTAKHCAYDGRIKASDAVVLAVMQGKWSGLIMHYHCAVTEGLS